MTDLTSTVVAARRSGESSARAAAGDPWFARPPGWPRSWPPCCPPRAGRVRPDHLGDGRARQGPRRAVRGAERGPPVRHRRTWAATSCCGCWWPPGSPWSWRSGATLVGVVIGVLLGALPTRAAPAGRPVRGGRGEHRGGISRPAARTVLRDHLRRRGDRRDARPRPGVRSRSLARLTQTLAAAVAGRDFISAARVVGVGRRPDLVPARAAEHRRTVDRQHHVDRGRQPAGLRRAVVSRGRRAAARPTTGAGCSPRASTTSTSTRWPPSAPGWPWCSPRSGAEPDRGGRRRGARSTRRPRQGRGPDAGPRRRRQPGRRRRARRRGPVGPIPQSRRRDHPGPRSVPADRAAARRSASSVSPGRARA